VSALFSSLPGRWQKPPNDFGLPSLAYEDKNRYVQYASHFPRLFSQHNNYPWNSSSSPYIINSNIYRKVKLEHGILAKIKNLFSQYR
jgi:hypothetical protein